MRGTRRFDFKLITLDALPSFLLTHARMALFLHCSRDASTYVNEELVVDCGAPKHTDQNTPIKTRRSKHADQNTPINSSRSKLANQNTPIKTRCPCSRRLISVGSEVCLCGQNALPLFTPTFMVWVIGVCLWTLSKRAALVHTDSFVPAFSRACSRRDVRSPSFDHTAALLVRTCVCSFRSRASRSHSLSSTASSGTTLYPRFLPTGART